MAQLTAASPRQLKADGVKVFAAIGYDYQMARIAGKAGAEAP